MLIIFYEKSNKMINNITILGSTGSIGTQSLEVCENLKINVIALSANKNSDLLIKQTKKFKPKYVVLTDENAYNKVKSELNGTDVKVLFGNDGLCFISSLKENDIVLNSVVGMVGLLPTISAIKSKTNVALANKETLVVGGKLVMNLAKEYGVKMLPVDSEHSAIFQCLQGAKREEMSKIILTASGGPFFGYTKEMLKKVKKSDALNHPNWSMGAKITIDSSTLMNKGLEFIEAMHLFSASPDDIEIVVNRESILHSAVEFIDGSVIAQMGTPSMKIPIQYALTFPNRVKSDVKRLSFTDIGKLTFYNADIETFICLKSAISAAKQGGILPAIVNGANEQAVKMFLQDKIEYYMIGECVEAALNSFKYSDYDTAEQIIEVDRKSRLFAEEFLNNYSNQ